MGTSKLAQMALRSAAIGYFCFLVLLPLLIIGKTSLAGGLSNFFDDLRQPQAAAAVMLTLEAGLLATAINCLFGTITAIVLVRYDFPGRWFLNSLVDLPFAIPTLVAGLMIAAVYGKTSPLGQLFEQAGIQVLYAKPGIILALLFVTMPFTIRALQPVLMELEAEQEEAAYTLGAGPWMTFWRVVVPNILPGLLTGLFLTFVRALGEFGAIVIVAGNIPMKTQVAAVYVYGELESYNPRGATSVSVLILVISFAALLLLARLTQPPGERLPRFMQFLWPRRSPLTAGVVH
jgi:sulfate transport system permease protein